MKRSEQITKYQKENTIQVQFRLNKKTDADLIEELDSIGNKAEFFRHCLRDRIEKKNRVII